MVHKAPHTGLKHTLRRHLQAIRLRIDATPGGATNLTPDTSALARSAWTHRTLRRFIKTTRVALLVMGCLHAKANVPGEFAPKKNQWQNPRGLSIPNLKHKAVVLFLHGSMVDKLDDPCDPSGEAVGFSVPEVIKELAGTEVSGMEVVVIAPCHGRATQMGEPLKIDQRVEAIEETLQELGRAGVDPSRIFLVGQSAGGWAALMHQKRHPGSVNSVVAFAPAFAGKKRFRPEIWQQRHEQQAAEILSANLISALVFAFNNDEYNSPDDLDFLSRIKGTTLLRMPDATIDGVVCDIPFFGSSHSNVYRKCFSSTQSNVLLNFLNQRLQAPKEVVSDAKEI